MRRCSARARLVINPDSTATDDLRPSNCMVKFAARETDLLVADRIDVLVRQRFDNRVVRRAAPCTQQMMASPAVTVAGNRESATVRVNR